MIRTQKYRSISQTFESSDSFIGISWRQKKGAWNTELCALRGEKKKERGEKNTKPQNNKTTTTQQVNKSFKQGKKKPQSSPACCPLPSQVSREQTLWLVEDFTGLSPPEGDKPMAKEEIKAQRRSCRVQRGLWFVLPRTPGPVMSQCQHKAPTPSCTTGNRQQQDPKKSPSAPPDDHRALRNKCLLLINLGS